MKNDKKIELLAPAGSFESLKASIANGADAVYLGGGKLNARANAANFTENEITQALDYAHERGRKVYITLNTLIKSQELSDALKFAEFLYKEGADAVIVQDLGLVKLLQANLPNLEIHASTQMTLVNSKAIDVIKSLGINRVVLPRELTLSELAHIKEQTSVELEVFVHGALCVSYSGQCLISSFIGRRSGNRGLCAQPCRLPWSASTDGEKYTEKSHLLSTKDLMAIELLPLLEDAGVGSLKLEGRMKSPEYVALVTSIYRKYLDMLDTLGKDKYKVDWQDKKILMQAFNRGGFTQEYLKGNKNYRKLMYSKHPKHQGVLSGVVTEKKPLYIKVKLDNEIDMGDGIEIINDGGDIYSFIVTSIIDEGKQVRTAKSGSEVWIGDVKGSVKTGSKAYKTLSKPLWNEARKSFEGKENPIVPINMELQIKTGEPVLLKVSDLNGNKALVESKDIAQKAIKLPLSQDRIKEQLSKTGDTVYYIKDLLISTDKVSTMPISALNAMRREALEKMKSLRIKMHKKAPLLNIQYDVAQNKPNNDQLLLSAFFNTLPSSLNGLNSLVSRIYIPITKADTIKKLRLEFSGEIYVWTPTILKDLELEKVEEDIRAIALLIDGIAYGNLGVYKLVKEEFPKLSLCAEPGLNIYNNEAVAMHGGLGATTAVLSTELNFDEIKKIAPSTSKLDLEAIVYGRIPLMTMEYCPSYLDMVCNNRCNECKGRQGFLKDRKGEVFPFLRDASLMRTQIFNNNPTFMDDVEALKETSIKHIRLLFTNEDASTRNTLVNYYSEKIKGNKSISFNLINEIDQIKDKGFTKGHWFRGVE